MRVIFMRGERLEEIKRLSKEDRAALAVKLLERALTKAKDVGAENFYALTCDVEEFVNRYCMFAGSLDEEGDPL
jgi:hypothetical protein